MRRKEKTNVLVIEDNPGDFLLIEDYLKDQDENFGLDHAKTLAHAQSKLSPSHHFDVILLDLSLPDAHGEMLVNQVVGLAGKCPVVVLTGFTDQEFGITTLSLGVSDYLLKDDLSPSQLHKSISYSIERKRIDIQLKASEAKYERLFHFSPLPMWVYDPSTLAFVDVNEAAIRLYGYTKEEFMSMTLPAVWPAKHYHEHREKVNQLLKNGEHFRGVTQHIKKSGELMFIEIQSDAIDLDGNRARIVSIADITEKTKAAKALQLSEQRFKALVQEGTDLIAILSIEGIFNYVSPPSKTILGISADNLIQKSVLDFIHTDDRERVKQHFNSLESQKSILIAPFRFRDAVGNWRWIETKLTNMIHDPSVGGIVANSMEVTERIISEIMIRESIDRYNIVAKATSDVIWDWDLGTQMVQWNENVKSVFGYNEVRTTAAWWYERVHPQDAKRVTSKIDKAIHDVNPYWQDEYRFRCADGTYKYFFDRGFLLSDATGRGIRMIGSMQDISKQKEEQNHLKLLESVITHATDAVMITDAGSIDEPGPRIVYVNSAFTEMTGYLKEEVLGRSPRFLQGAQTSREALLKIRKALENREPCQVETINYKKNGNKFWLNMAIAPVTDTTGAYTHFISIQRDITNQMNYINAIEAQNERLKEIAWMQSHIVRAPLARIMGLVEILPKYESQSKIPAEVLKYILESAHELDQIVRDIVLKTEDIYNTEKNDI